MAAPAASVEVAKQETTTEEKQDDVTWDATKIEKALAHLEELQEQISKLRSMHTNLLRPLAMTRHTSKAQVMDEMRKAATSTAADMQNLRANWTSETTQQLLVKAQQSRSADPDLSKAADVPAWGWIPDD